MVTMPDSGAQLGGGPLPAQDSVPVPPDRLAPDHASARCRASIPPWHLADVRI